jgi:hypothetical protein
MRHVTIFLLGLLVAGCDSALVGGECLDGYTKDDGACARVGDGGAGGDSPGGEGGAGGDGGAGGGRARRPIAIDRDFGRGDGGAGGAPPDTTPLATGHIVALGLDVDSGVTARDLLTNATLLSLHDPVRILIPGRLTGARVVSHVESAITSGVEARGREAVFAWASLDAPPDAPLVEQSDVVLVSTRALGRERGFDPGWRDALVTFAARGGVVIVLAHPRSPAGTAALLSDTGLLPGIRGAGLDQAEVTVATWTDALAVGLAWPLDVHGPVVAFSLPEETDAVTVARADDGAAVAVHRAISP